ncbi:2-polyprenyl-6-methoxyphenol hydroxylase [Kaistia soli DSM 19436]|uniref:2-polyprenyl-6-methoxyphenol hydroxylase n=1 Tax=Kaistia soli DSM 19436 TaxID=1122133 RepID=A0A1M5DJX1_9HYPH|nr:FAD binding domain-containing protein [Kaistia soli]SHF67194.1 2-polyprenyl-6-methoxyphenol hydroxylase [Kaistia soli DSM 19436]
MSPHILVVGGSIGGLFVTTLLQREGFDISIRERSIHGLDGRGAGLVAQREVFDMLREIGRVDLARFGVTAKERIYLDRTGAILSRQSMPQTQLSWDTLFRTFRAMIPSERYQGGVGIERVERDGAGLILRHADGTGERADLVIGADGIGSRIRAAVAGDESRPRYVGYATWRGLVPEAAMPAAAAETLFERFAFYEMPGSHILGYLVPGADGSVEPGRRRYNWVWYRRYSETELSSVLTDADGKVHPFSLAPPQVPRSAVERLHADAADLLPPAFAAAVLAEPRPFVHAIFDYNAPRMVEDGVALLGDAAFVARPHTAMGVAKAAGDAFALRDALVRYPDLPEALAAYERSRLDIDRAVVAYGVRLGAALG